MQGQPFLKGQTRHTPPSTINCQLEQLKQTGPEWDGPGSITPSHAVIDRAASWLTKNWQPRLGTPSIYPTADGGISIIWDSHGMEYSIDVNHDASTFQWCQYDPRTLHTAEKRLPMDKTPIPLQN